MSSLFRSGRRPAGDDRALPAAVPERVPRAGAYLTDEVFLYRVLGPVASVGSELVELEDCYSLDVVRVPLRDLRARSLRVVTPGHVEG